ncbi:hypothetical protein ACQCX5_05630 [Propionibacteriaceae bacterium G57]|uniref:hypothetical protein n=1 Tax=Aestuariimicrobium sp. G57 TaxID=3418485 RepID=UPI003DA6E57B
MRELNTWWDHLSTMGRDTLVVWWQAMPRAVPITMVAYVLSQATLLGAAYASEKLPWLALALLSLGLVFTLSAMIVSLQVMGKILGIRDEVPRDEVDDDRDESLTRLIAVTLLPFLGIYAAFDHVQRVANTLVAQEIVIRGLFTDTILGNIRPSTLDEARQLIIIVAALYIVRRLVDLAHEKTDFRPLGLVAALIEGFFLFLVVFVSGTLLSTLLASLQSTRVAAWFYSVNAGFKTTIGTVHELLPQLWDALGNFINWLWPVFTHAFVQPIVWLAVAALVYGSHVLSFAEMWRKGEPLSAHLDTQRQIVLDKRGRRRANAGTTGRRAIIEVQEALFGDLNDKYLPTFQSLRLVMRGGVLFLAAYVLLYTVVSVVADGFTDSVIEFFGGRAPEFWVAWADLITGLTAPFGTTLELALLAVAFKRVLTLFRDSADPSAVRPEHRAQAEAAQAESAQTESAKVGVAP